MHTNTSMYNTHTVFSTKKICALDLSLRQGGWKLDRISSLFKRPEETLGIEIRGVCPDLLVLLGKHLSLMSRLPLSVKTK